MSPGSAEMNTPIRGSCESRSRPVKEWAASFGVTRCHEGPGMPTNASCRPEKNSTEGAVSVVTLIRPPSEAPGRQARGFEVRGGAPASSARCRWGTVRGNRNHSNGIDARDRLRSSG